MYKLEDFAPSKHEEQLTSGMPEQVRIGYIRAMRKANAGRRSPEDTGGFGDLFGDLFRKGKFNG